MKYKAHIIKLFNQGVLTIKDAYWFGNKGFAIICAKGLVVDIVQE